MDRHDLTLEGFLTTQEYAGNNQNQIHLKQIGVGSVLVVVPKDMVPLEGHYQRAKITIQIEVDSTSRFVPDLRGR